MPQARSVAQYAESLQANLDALAGGRITLDTCDAVAHTLRVELLERHLLVGVVGALLGASMRPGAASPNQPRRPALRS